VNILHDFAPYAIDSERVETTLSLMRGCQDFQV
jgi:hypothetical protein